MAPPRRKPLDPSTAPKHLKKSKAPTYDTFDEALDGGVELAEKGERYRTGDKVSSNLFIQSVQFSRTQWNANRPSGFLRKLASFTRKLSSLILKLSKATTTWQEHCSPLFNPFSSLLYHSTPSIPPSPTTGSLKHSPQPRSFGSMRLTTWPSG